MVRLLPFLLIANVCAVEVITPADIDKELITRVSLRAIFSLHQRHWPDGSPIKVFVLPSTHPTHRQFARALGFYPYQLKNQWERLTFSGMATAPTEVTSESQMLELVRKTPGAIGYMFSTVEQGLDVNEIPIQ